MSENDNFTENNLLFKKYGNLYFIYLLLKYKYFIAAIVIAVTVISVIIALKMKNEYAAVVSAVPPRISNSMLDASSSAITSAIKEIGLTQLGGKSDASYSFMVILRSRSLQDSVIKKFNLKEVYQIKDTLYSSIRKEFEEHFEIFLDKPGNYNITVWDSDPKRAADMANYIIECSNTLAVQFYQNELKINRVYLEDRLKSIENSLSMISDSLSQLSGKKLIFSPQEQARSISSALAEMKAKVMENEVYLQLYKMNFGANDPATRMQENLLDELRKKASEAELKPGFAGNFPLKDAAKVGIDYMRLYTLYEAYTKMKAVLMPMIEKSKIDEIRNSASLYIIDSAIPPEKKDRPKRTILVLSGFFGSFVAAVLLVIAFEGLKNLILSYKRIKNNF